MIKINLAAESLGEAFSAFLSYCKFKNLSSSTLSNYKETCSKMVAEIGAETPVNAAITKRNVQAYIMMLKGDINTHIARIRVFVYWCFDEYQLPRFRISLIKQEEKYKEPYTREEIRKMLEKPTSADFDDWRNWCLVSFFCSTGARIGSAVEVKVKDINFRDKQVILTKSKTKKVQVIPLSDKLAETLKFYIGLWNPAADDYLFPSSRTRDKIDTKALSHSLANYIKRRGIEKTGVHRFRNTFAKEFIVSGGNAFVLQQILGHSSMDMTRRYVKLYSADLAINFDKFCLLDNLN